VLITERERKLSGVKKDEMDEREREREVDEIMDWIQKRLSFKMLSLPTPPLHKLHFHPEYSITLFMCFHSREIPSIKHSLCVCGAGGCALPEFLSLLTISGFHQKCLCCLIPIIIIIIM